MPKLIHRNPAYRKHRRSGQAVVTINGKDIYLGQHGSKASRDAYDRVISEWLAAGRTGVDESALVTVGELLVAYRTHCQAAYPKVAGERSSEAENIRLALRPLRRLYGPTPAGKFGPLKLKALIDEFIRLGWSRTHINRQLGRVKGFFRWAVSNEMIPPSIIHGLATVGGLRRGRGEVKESAPVKPVAAARDPGRSTILGCRCRRRADRVHDGEKSTRANRDAG